MLDEECVVPKGSDMSLLQKMTETHRKCQFFEKPRKRGQEVTFVVNHYAGGVAYSVEKFLEKNKDLLQADIQVRFLTEIVDDFRRFVDEIWRF